MTLDQLRIFVAVAERQHVTRAAESLHIAQSAASASIAALESQHGAKLFHRLGRGIELTEAGSLFLAEAQAVLAGVERAELVLSELAGLKTGTLSLFASQTIASYWLPHHLVRFRRAHPGIAVRLSVGNTAQAAAAVRDGLAELGFVEGAVDEQTLVASEIARDQLVIVVGTAHPWCARTSVSGPQFLETEWVLREPGSGTRSEFETALAGVRPQAERSDRRAGTADEPIRTCGCRGRYGRDGPLGLRRRPIARGRSSASGPRGAAGPRL